MEINWGQVFIWFVTSFIGAGIVKLFDIWSNRYQQRKNRIQQKVEKLLSHLNDFGELVRLHGMNFHLTMWIEHNLDGSVKIDENGNPIIVKTAIGPNSQLEKAVLLLKGSDINTAIAQKIAQIQIGSSEANDLCLELDPKGGLKSLLDNVYQETITVIESLSKNIDKTDPVILFRDAGLALQESDKARQILREKLEKHIQG